MHLFGWLLLLFGILPCILLEERNIHPRSFSRLDHPGRFPPEVRFLFWLYGVCHLRCSWKSVWFQEFFSIPPCSLFSHQNENLMSKGNVSYFCIDLKGQLISAFGSVDAWAGHHWETAKAATALQANRRLALKMAFISILSSANAGASDAVPSFSHWDVWGK